MKQFMVVPSRGKEKGVWVLLFENGGMCKKNKMVIRWIEEGMRKNNMCCKKKVPVNSCFFNSRSFFSFISYYRK